MQTACSSQNIFHSGNERSCRSFSSEMGSSSSSIRDTFETSPISGQSDVPEYSPDSWRPKVVVVGPGGVKGFIELGALVFLKEKGILDSVDSYIGVSVGALLSLLIVSGYTIREIIAIAADTDIFHGLSSLSLKKMSENSGLISSEPIRKKLTDLITAKFGRVLTLYQLYMATGLTYVAVTLNIDTEETEYMGPNTTPHISCVDATMLSMNIPFLFYRLIHKGNVYIDGALGNPYPVDYFDDGQTDILGIYIEELYPHRQNKIRRVNRLMTVEPAESPQERTSTEDLPFSIYLNKVIQASMNQHRKHIIKHSSSSVRHLALETSVLDFTGLSVSAQEKANLIVAGYAAAKRFVDSFDSP